MVFMPAPWTATGAAGTIAACKQSGRQMALAELPLANLLNGISGEMTPRDFH
jgi:hypothetical protein